MKGKRGQLYIVPAIVMTNNGWSWFAIPAYANQSSFFWIIIDFLCNENQGNVNQQRHTYGPFNNVYPSISKLLKRFRIAKLFHSNTSHFVRRIINWKLANDVVEIAILIRQFKKFQVFYFLRHVDIYILTHIPMYEVMDNMGLRGWNCLAPISV